MRIKLSIPILLSELSFAINGSNINDNSVIEYISTDTRNLLPKDLFIAIKGEKYNGLDFLSEAKAIGAYTLSESNDSTIFTNNINEAILKLIRHYKSKLTHLKHTILITGSVGKTSAKEFLYALINTTYKAHATYKNYNNIYGVMHTVLSANFDTEVLICEVGMNNMGEISPISTALSPDIAIITNIGSAHIGKLGSRENLATAKLEVCNGLCKDGITIIPNGEPLLLGAVNRHIVSLKPDSYDSLLLPLSLSEKGSYFDFYSGNVFLKNLFLKIPGEHILKTFALSLTAAVKIKTPTNKIKEALTRINESLLRQRLIKINRYLIYDDTYNSSYEALIATAKMLMLYNKEISAVLSDILELGSYSEELHYKCGYELAKMGIKQLYLSGNSSYVYMRGAIDGGMKKENIHINNECDGYIHLAKEISENYSGEILLIKGSHSTHLSDLINKLKEIGE